MSGKVADNPYRASGVVAAAGGGAISWCTTVKTGAFCAAAGSGYLVNTTSTAFTATLPTGPADGDQIAFVDFAGTFDSNALTLGRGGSKIKAQCKCATIDAERGAITIVYSGSTQGWIQTSQGNDGTMAQAEFVTATGGTTGTCGNFKVHTFIADGCFVVSSAGNASGSTTVDYLVIAGGGGGGRGQGTGDQKGGGGGAGGYLASYPNPATAGFPISASPGTYPITVGAGGSAGGPSGSGKGANSVFSTVTTTGGGGGGDNNPARFGGQPGGSGGGENAQGTGCGGSGNTPPASSPSNPVQGFNGGEGSSAPAAGGGGGGGASAIAGNGATATGGAGGAGFTSTINFSSVARGGGGGGGAGGAGGIATAGGGNGSGCSPCAGAVAGTANTGGGGGAGGSCTASSNGAAGGKGVVYIRYKYQ